MPFSFHNYNGLKNFYLLLWKAKWYTETETHRGKKEINILWFLLQTAAMTSVGPGYREQAGTPSWSPSGRWETQEHAPFSDVFSGATSGIDQKQTRHDSSLLLNEMLAVQAAVLFEEPTRTSDLFFIQVFPHFVSFPYCGVNSEFY